MALNSDACPASRYLIVDLEATCCRDKSIPNREREIIEIGAVIYDSIVGKTVADFQSYVKPLRHPRLTDFCQRLTGINQRQVDEAPTFSEAFLNFSAWVQEFQDIIFLHWGSYDRKALEADCRFHGIPYTLPSKSLDFKKFFHRKLNIGKRAGLNETLNKVGLKFEGKPHSALSDAKNTCRLVSLLLKKHPDAFSENLSSTYGSAFRRPEIEIEMRMDGTICILRPLTPEIEEESPARSAVKQSIQFIRNHKPEEVMFDFSEVNHFNWVNAFPVKIIKGCQHDGLKIPFRVSGMNETISAHLKKQKLDMFFELEPSTNADLDKRIDDLEFRRILNMFSDPVPDDILELAGLYVIKRNFEASKNFSEFYLRICRDQSLEISRLAYKYLGLSYLGLNKKWEAYSFLNRYLKDHKAADADTLNIHHKLRNQLHKK